MSRLGRGRVFGLGLVGLGLTLVGCGEPDSAGESESSTGESVSDSGTDPSAGGTATAGEVCEEAAEHSGEATYYDADGSGNCSFDASADRMIAAINEVDYAGSAPCGACAEVEGPDGTVSVRIVDRCPGCAPGDLDLSVEAFEMIAAKEKGRVDISWRFVPCAVEGPLRYRFKEGSSQWWTAVQVRNHRHAVASLEYSQDGGETYIPIARETYNYFVAPEGMGAESFSLRVVDVYGQVVVDDGVLVGDAVEVSGAANTPACGG